MIDEITNDLFDELKIAEGVGEEIIPLIRIKVKTAYKEVKAARKYPKGYVNIDSDMENFYSQIKSLALYDYNQLGAEGEDHHSENGVSRSYIDRDSLFNGVIPIGGVS